MRRLCLAALIAVILGTSAVAGGSKTQNGKDSGNNQTQLDNKPPKVDKALAGALASGATTQKVIITARAGSLKNLRKKLEGNGRKIRREHTSLSVLVTELSTAEV